MGQCLSALQEVVEGSTSELASGGGGGVPSTTATDGLLSPLYPSLPEGAEKVQVRNVYDGDTLTLIDERRVRFLGIDTPELKEKQPFAEEAKVYTKNLCHKQEIWISYEPGHEKQDHYGRLLCFVWVQNPGGGYLSVNEGIVSEGLANAYIPSKDSKLHNWDKLLELQNQARAAKKGLWSTFQDIIVYKTVNGSAYHQKNCSHLARSRNIIEVKASEASSQGLHPCRTCMAD